jgi:Ankyrin repeats (3 copies)
MNKYILAVKDLDLVSTTEILRKDPKWIGWAEPSGKNALHYLCGVEIAGKPQKAGVSLQILKLLLKGGMDINSIHRIKEGHGFFPATPLWYAYTRGRNETLYKFLLAKGADPENCMFAIAWYDDVKAAALFKKHGAKITDSAGQDNPFLAAFAWKKFSVAEWFLKNGADVNVAEEKGNTALFYAVAMKRKYEIADIKLLLRYGADINKKNNEGVSPLERAKQDSRKSVLDLFETLGLE